MNTDLARKATVRELVAAFQQAETVVRASFAALVAAEHDVNQAFAFSESRAIRIDASNYGHYDSFGNPDQCIERMGREAWSAIVDRLELRRMMSIKRYEQMRQHLEKGKLPPITEANVTAFVEQHVAGFREMIEEAVEEVFDWLRPRARTRAHEYKTNTELEIRRRVVLTGIVDKYEPWKLDRFSVNYHYTQNLTALENVFNALDGQGQVNKTYRSALQNAIDSSWPSGRGETSLFRFRVFKNGNMHLEFKRLDLLKRFNQIAGGRRLRPAEGSAA